ncbi:MAG: DUF4230 domain-containing protein [Bacteroidota bacterium]
MLNLKNRSQRKLALVKQVVMLLVLITTILLLMRWCKKSEKESRFEIENSPIKVELIRSIAQLATISYKDEVVVDSLEYYSSANEQILGNISKLVDIDNIKHGLKSSNIKRRLTLIVKGEINIGFNLKDKKFKIQETDSLIKICIPKPIILDVLSTPSTTRVFQENGSWKDYEITVLKNKARDKMRRNVEQLQLKTKAKENLERFLRPLIKKNKKVIFEVR